jgi:hypothetical protein
VSNRLPVAADLPEKFSMYTKTLGSPGAVGYVLWWQPQDDPALSSLGGGVLTLTTVSASDALNEQGIVLANPTGGIRDTIPRASIIDLRYAPIHPLSPEEMGEFVKENQDRMT